MYRVDMASQVSSWLAIHGNRYVVRPRSVHSGGVSRLSEGTVMAPDEESIEAMNDSVNELTEASGIDQDDIQLIVDGFKDMVIDIQEVIPE